MTKYDKNGSSRYFKIKKWHCEPIIKIMVNVHHIKFFFDKFSWSLALKYSKILSDLLQ